MVNTTVQQNRTAWLEALRSGMYQQGEGALFKYRDLGHGGQHCCIGVELSTEGYSDILAAEIELNPHYDESEAYEVFRANVGVSAKVQSYLEGMNDGNTVTQIEKTSTKPRSFKFIARFLEILWALEEQQA